MKEYQRGREGVVVGDGDLRGAMAGAEGVPAVGAAVLPKREERELLLAHQTLRAANAPVPRLVKVSEGK